MSTHFWMISGATVLASAVMGLGLGGYVTSPQRSALAGDMAIETSDGAQAYGDASPYAPVQEGPAVIRCTGCGPTLADRRWQADMATLDIAGAPMPQDINDDPLARSYYGSDHETGGDISHDPSGGVQRPSAPSDAHPPVHVTRTVSQAPLPLPAPLSVPMETDSGESLP
ncbi:MAG: hypothetical protein V4512_09685 [Pseudomonadota bacterium]